MLFGVPCVADLTGVVKHASVRRDGMMVLRAFHRGNDRDVGLIERERSGLLGLLGLLDERDMLFVQPFMFSLSLNSASLTTIAFLYHRRSQLSQWA